MIGFFGADVGKGVEHALQAVLVDELFKLLKKGHLLFSAVSVSMDAI